MIYVAGRRAFGRIVLWLYVALGCIIMQLSSDKNESIVFVTVALCYFECAGYFPIERQFHLHMQPQKSGYALYICTYTIYTYRERRERSVCTSVHTHKEANHEQSNRQ